jgi:quinol monooxygenase YgiN
MSSTIVRFAPTLAVFALVVVWAFELDDPVVAAFTAVNVAHLERERAHAGHHPRANASRAASPPGRRDFVFVGKLRVRPGGAPRLLELARPLVEHARAREPQTIGYEVLLSDRDPDEVLMLERYTSREAMLDPHKRSAPFLEFKRRVDAENLLVSKAGSSWLGSGVGYRTFDETERRFPT